MSDDTKKINTTTELSMSRNSRDMFTVLVQDSRSRAMICKVSMTPEQFAMAISGTYVSDLPTVCGDLAQVGKKRIIEKRTATISHDDYWQCSEGDYSRKKEKLGQWLIENHSEPGWNIDTYLGSQGSISAQPDGSYVLRYQVYRFEAQE